jgi:hypothetical protein
MFLLKIQKVEMLNSSIIVMHILLYYESIMQLIEEISFMLKNNRLSGNSIIDIKLISKY